MLYHTEKGTGKPLLLIHGFGANTFSFKEWMEILKDRCRVIAVDLKGFGKSPKPRDHLYTIDEQIRCVEEVMDHLDLDDVTVCGHSYGGAIALGLAERRRHRDKGNVRGLVVVAGAAYPQKLPPFFHILKSNALSSIGLKLISHKTQVEYVLKQCFYDRTRVTPERIEAYAEPLKDEGSSHAMSQVIRQIVPPDVDSFVAAYRSIDIPVLIIWGREDRIIPLETAERLKADIPHAVLKVIERCGHVPNEEFPEQTAGDIRSFLDGLDL